MATLAFTCSWCKKATASSAAAYNRLRNRFVVAVTCASCLTPSLISFETRYSDGNDETCASWWPQWLTSGRGSADGVLTPLVDKHWPALREQEPAGITDEKLIKRWREAEAASANPDVGAGNAAGAYGRVLERAVRLIDSKPDSSEMLGRRVERIVTEGIVSRDLADLMHAAKVLPTEGIHADDDIDEDDARIARDLVKAFLIRQFTIPFLAADAAERMNRRNGSKAP